MTHVLCRSTILKTVSVMCAKLQIFNIIMLSCFLSFQDGRLRQNDQLLQINEESVIHMRHEEVIGKLRIVSQSGKPMKLVISRRVCSGESEMVPDINDVS